MNKTSGSTDSRHTETSIVKESLSINADSWSLLIYVTKLMEKKTNVQITWTLVFTSDEEEDCLEEPSLYALVNKSCLKLNQTGHHDRYTTGRSGNSTTTKMLQ